MIRIDYNCDTKAAYLWIISDDYKCQPRSYQHIKTPRELRKLIIDLTDIYRKYSKSDLEWN